MEVYEPLGCIAIICGNNDDENSPLLSFIINTIGAIAFGNTVVVVPDEKCPIPALDLYQIFETSDLPGGVINILTGPKQHLTKHLCEHQNVNGIWYCDNKSTNELLSHQFIKYSSNFNLKSNWLIPSNALSSDEYISQYHKEMKLRSTQSKYIHLPMGVIFAN
jgi:aldehyde dehydrogenase (NAD+)